MITQSGPVGDLRRPSVVGRVRRWSLWSLSRAAVCYFLAVELLTLVLLTVVLAHAHVASLDLGRFALLAVLGLGYAEVSDRVERLKRYIVNDGIWSNHTSVWAFAGVLVLPGAYAALLVFLVFAQQLWLGHRYQSVHPYRVVFIASSMVLATLAGSAFLHAVGGGIMTSGLRAALVTVGAFGIFPVVNLGVLISGRALAAKTTRISSLLPDRDTVGYELMTLILGVFTGSQVLHTPWLTPLVLGLLAGLHRNSLVKSLRVAASIDAKTGLLNSAAWQDRAEQGLSRASRANQPVAVVMIDLDHFKKSMTPMVTLSETECCVRLRTLWVSSCVGMTCSVGSGVRSSSRSSKDPPLSKPSKFPNVYATASPRSASLTSPP